MAFLGKKCRLKDKYENELTISFTFFSRSSLLTLKVSSYWVSFLAFPLVFSDFGIGGLLSDLILIHIKYIFYTLLPERFGYVVRQL